MTEPDTYPAPRHGWNCFHCGEHFPPQSWMQARQHFGWTPDYKPACLIKGSKDHGLLWRLRAAERALADLKARVLHEDTDKDRQMAAVATAHATALRREEEMGYARGLRDAGWQEIADIIDAAIEATQGELNRLDVTRQFIERQSRLATAVCAYLARVRKAA